MNKIDYAEIRKIFLITSPFNPTYEVRTFGAGDSSVHFKNLDEAKVYMANEDYIPVSEKFFYRISK